MITSNQVAGVISAQQAAAYNQGVTSQAIGVTSGLTKGALQPMQPASHISMPMASAAMSAVPMAVGGAKAGVGVAGMAASFGIGGAVVGRAALADPAYMAFAGATRGWSGARAGLAASQGVRGVAGMRMALAANTVSKVGWAGRAAAGIAGATGMGGLGLGIIGGAAAAAVPLAGWAALQYGATRAYQGFQQNKSMETFASANFRFSNKGTGRQGLDKSSINEMTERVRDVATEMGTTFDDMMGTLQDVTDMRMLDTVRTSRDFERKFKTITDTMKTVSTVLGVSAKEAVGFMGSMRLSGISGDVATAHNVIQRRVLASEGLTGQDFTNVQRFGGGLAHRYGARRGHGTRLATRLTSDMARANRMGIYSDEELIEATGMEGREAYMAMAQVGTQTAFQFTQSAPGQAVMAYAGEIVDGRYTGRIDAGRMRSISSGAVAPGDIATLGRARMGNDRETQLSFQAQKKRLAGDLAEQGGPELVGSIVRSIAGDRFGEMGEDDIVTLLMDKFTGLDQTQAEILTRMSKEVGEISRVRRRDEREELDRVIRDTERGMYHSLEGTKTRLRQGWEEKVRNPVMQLGSDFRTRAGKDRQAIADDWYGRHRTQEVSDTRLADIAAGYEDDVQVSHMGLRLDAGEMSETARERHMSAVADGLATSQALKWGGPGGFAATRAADLRVTPMGIGGISHDDVYEMEAMEKRRATGTVRAADVNMEDYQGDQLEAARQLIFAMPTGMDYEDDKAVGKMRDRMLSGSVMRGNDALREAVSHSLGVSETRLKWAPSSLSREDRAKAADLVRYQSQVAGRDVGLATEDEYMTGATSENTAEQYDDALIDVFGHENLLVPSWKQIRGTSWYKPWEAAATANPVIGRLLSRTNVRGLDFGSDDKEITRILEGDSEGRDALFSAMLDVSEGDDSVTEDLEDYLKALESGAEDLWTDDRFDRFEALGEDGARAALGALKRTGTSSAQQQAIRQLIAGSKGMVPQEAQQLLQGRGAEMKESLKDAELGDISSGFSDAVEAYASSLGEGRGMGNQAGLDEAKRVRAEIQKLGSGERRTARESLAAVDGGTVLLQQIDALSKKGDLAKATTMDEVSQIVDDLGLEELSGKRQEAVEAALEDGTISAEEATALTDAWATQLGAQDAMNKGGSVVTASIHGESAILAAQMAESEVIHGQFMSTSAEAIEKIAKAAGVDPTPTSPKSVDPKKK